MYAKKTIKGDIYTVSVLAYDSIKWMWVKVAETKSEGQAIRMMEACRELATVKECIDHCNGNKNINLL